MLVQRVAVSRRRCRWRGGEKKEALCKTEIRRDDPTLHWSACDVVGTPQHVMFVSPWWNKVNWRTNLASQLEKRNTEEKGSPFFFSLHVNDSCIVEQTYSNQERGGEDDRLGPHWPFFFFCRHWSHTLVSRPSEEPCWSLSLSLSLSCSVTILSPVGFIASLRQRILIKYKFSALLGVQLHFLYWPKTMCVPPLSSFVFLWFFLFFWVWFRTFLHDLIRGT